MSKGLSYHATSRSFDLSLLFLVFKSWHLSEAIKNRKKTCLQENWFQHKKNEEMRLSLLILFLLNPKIIGCIETFLRLSSPLHSLDRTSPCRWKRNGLIKISDRGREPWSSGNGKRLTFQRSWVWIPAPFTGWTFFQHIFVVRIVKMFFFFSVKKSK